MWNAFSVVLTASTKRSNLHGTPTVGGGALLRHIQSATSTQGWIWLFWASFGQVLTATQMQSPNNRMQVEDGSSCSDKKWGQNHWQEDVCFDWHQLWKEIWNVKFERSWGQDQEDILRTQNECCDRRVCQANPYFRETTEDAREGFSALNSQADRHGRRHRLQCFVCWEKPCPCDVMFSPFLLQPSLLYLSTPSFPKAPINTS